MLCWICLSLMPPPPQMQTLLPPSEVRIIAPGRTRPKVCAVPLIRVPLPRQAFLPMPVQKPGRSIDPRFVVTPPPPCDDKR